ncbi:AMIN domain-containing protein, partial [Oceanospirillum sp. HFRX-1_2]
MSSDALAASSALKSLDLRTTENRQAELTLQLDKPAARVQSYQIDNPARLIIDLFNTENHLAQKSFQFNQSMVQSVTGIQAGNRTRLVVKLDQSSSFQTRTQGSEIKVLIGQLAPATVAGSQSGPKPATPPATAQLPRIRDLDFRRGPNNESLFVLELERSDIDFQLTETDSKNLRLELKQATLPKALRRKLDVSDFATPVQNISARQQSDNARFDFQLKGDF